MKKINILHIAEIDNDKTKGTSTIIPQYVIQQQLSDKFNVSFLNCNNDELIYNKTINDIYCLNDNENNAIIDKVKPDIVVFHELYKLPYLKIYKYLVKKKIPYVIIPHGGMTKRAQNSKKIKKMLGNLLFFNDFFNNASKIQYLSINEKNCTCFKRLDNIVVGNGISNFPVENMYHKKNNKKSDDISFIYVGRYDYLIKGLDQLLEAFFLAKENSLNVKLIMYGKGNDSDTQKIKNYIKNNKLEKYIEFNGPIYDEEKRKTIVKNDVFIQVSRTEGQPLGVMEAMALGMPVLLSEGTGYSEIVNLFDIGEICKTNKDDIFNKIKSFIASKELLHEKSQNSYFYAKKFYSWENILNNTRFLYLEIIEKRK